MVDDGAEMSCEDAFTPKQTAQAQLSVSSSENKYANQVLTYTLLLLLTFGVNSFSRAGYSSLCLQNDRTRQYNNTVVLEGHQRKQ